MQKTPWFHEEQADVMLNYLPLRNVLIQDIKATVKNKALPDSARLCNPPSSHSLSLSLSLPHRLGPIKAGLTCLLSLANAIHPESIPWILLRLDPGIYQREGRHITKALWLSESFIAQFHIYKNFLDG